MSVITLASWIAHARSTQSGMPSGPTAFQMFTRLKDRVTSATAAGALSVWAVLSASKRA